MPHIYRLFEIKPDGSLVDTGKTVECDPPKFDRYDDIESYGNAARVVLDVYKFNSNFDSYYKSHVSKRDDDDIVIEYQKVPTWHLKKGS